MSLVDDRGALVRSAELEAQLARASKAWVRVAANAPWLERDDVIAVGVSRRARSIGIVDDGGLPAVVGPNDPRARLGDVLAIVRDGGRVDLDRSSLMIAVTAGSEHAFRRALATRLRLGATAAGLLHGLAAPAASDTVRAAHEHGSAEQDEEPRLHPAERMLVERWLRPGARVLGVGCGAGREVLALSRSGMHVHAVDDDDRSLDVARDRAKALGLAMTFARASPERIDVPDVSFDAVLLASDVLARLAGRPARVASLREASRIVRSGGIVAFRAELVGGRLAPIVDGPRAVLRALDRARVEPGDRWSWRGAPPELVFRHLYVDDREVIDDVESARLAWEARIGAWCVARREEEARPSSRAHAGRASLAEEIARVLVVLPSVERRRRALGPEPLIGEMRRTGAAQKRRDAGGRAQLRRAIESCDRLVPSGAGCYRRTLLEVALDAGAAEEPFHLALHDKRSGHAWLDANAPAELPPIVFTF